MFEINKAGENTYYIKFPTILGIYKINETKANAMAEITIFRHLLFLIA